MTAITDQPPTSRDDGTDSAAAESLRHRSQAHDPSIDAMGGDPRASDQGAQRSDRSWRIIGLLAMFLASIVLGWSLYGGLDPSPGQSRAATSATQPVRIEVSNFGIEPGMYAAAVSGGDQTAILSTGVFEGVPVPANRVTVVGLYRPGGTLIGLTTVEAGAAEPAIDATRITPRTTAQTLVSLFPGVTNRDRIEVNRRVSEATILPQFKDLERAILEATDLLAEDRNLEFALGSTVGALLPRDIVEPQCTTSGLSLAGVCISAGAEGIDIKNQLSRWALMFDSEDAVRMCAAIPPAPATLTLTSTGPCSTRLHLVAPGPFSEDRMLPGGLTRGQMQIASSLTAFSSWAVPFSDAVYGTNAGAGSGSVERIAAATSLINTQIRTTVEGDATLERLALDLGDPSASSRQRATATVGLSRALLDNNSIASDLIGDRVLGDNDGTRLLDLIARGVEWVTPDAPLPFWQTSPTAEVDLTRFIGTGS